MKDFKLDEELKELTKHRTIELPIACYETTISKNVNGYIPLHWHEEVQFVLVRRGEGIFQINEVKVVLKEGEGLFINSGQLHMAEENLQTGCDYICLNVSPHYVLPHELYSRYVFPYIKATNLPYRFIGTKSSWEKNILNSILSVHFLIEEKAPYFELDTFMVINQMWKELIMNGLPLEYDEVEAVKQSRMKQMVTFIHHHYGEKITLDDIAGSGHLSRAECCRYFKAMLRKTPLTYVLDYRIQKSLVLLQQPDANVTDVGYEVGFNSTSYFISKFRNKMDMTPLAYKKEFLSNYLGEEKEKDGNG
ncbi:AraC family transcriptional regulator [Alkalihalobacillus sp. CinArs1]|uniref:AraC family transcriptional regulator n=1 Tax=Alkalihalobacillus sp. CinArs1 TaxID=2995314 RepID=UPI0022DDC618|nr:AraC family transcriptional regulator [Alkalihalobacillus sp. CinArs1]